MPGTITLPPKNGRFKSGDIARERLFTQFSTKTTYDFVKTSRNHLTTEITFLF